MLKATQQIKATKLPFSGWYFAKSTALGSVECKMRSADIFTLGPLLYSFVLLFALNWYLFCGSNQFYLSVFCIIWNG